MFQNVRKVDTFFSDEENTDDSDSDYKVNVKQQKKATKEKVKLLPRYTDSPDVFDVGMNESDI